MHRETRPPAHGDRLEVLGTHDRAQAVAPVEVRQVAGDAGVAHEALACRPDQRHAHLGVTDLGPDGVLRLPGDQAPQGGGVADLDAVGCHQQVRGARRAPREDERGDAGARQLGAPVPAGLRPTQRAGQRRARADGEARDRRPPGPGEQAGGEDQHALGRERPCPGRLLAQQETQRGAGPAEEAPMDVVGLPRLADRAGRQVDPHRLSGERHVSRHVGAGVGVGGCRRGCHMAPKAQLEGLQRIRPRPALTNPPDDVRPRTWTSEEPRPLLQRSAATVSATIAAASSTSASSSPRWATKRKVQTPSSSAHRPAAASRGTRSAALRPVARVSA